MSHNKTNQATLMVIKAMLFDMTEEQRAEFDAIKAKIEQAINGHDLALQMIAISMIAMELEAKA